MHAIELDQPLIGSSDYLEAQTDSESASSCASNRRCSGRRKRNVPSRVEHHGGHTQSGVLRSSAQIDAGILAGQSANVDNVDNVSHFPARLGLKAW